MTTFVPQFPNFPVLSDCISSTRQFTGNSNNFQYTDEQIVQLMQSFYLYDLPAKFRSLKLKDIYTFTTNVGQEVYPFNSQLYTTVNEPCYCAKREIKLFTDPWNFFGVNYNWQQMTNFASGDNSNGPFSGFTTAKPLVASINNDPGSQSNPNLYFPQSRVQNILITANVVGSNGIGNTQNITDDGQGNLIQISQTSNNSNQEYGWTYYRDYIGSGGVVSPTPVGTINYQTGEISDLYFSQVIPSGTPIQIQYNPKTLAIPLSIMFYQNQFTIAPVPNAGYTIELTCYRQPIQALLAASETGNPELAEWWEILAVGAAKKIFQRRLDDDGEMRMDKMLHEFYDIIESRTYAQIGQQQIRTIYSDQLNNNYSSGGFFGGSGAV